MPGNDDKKKVLYDAVSKDYDIGTYDEFISKLNDPNKRKSFYEGVGSEYDLGDYNTFNQKLGFDSQETKQKSQLPFLSTPEQQLGKAISGTGKPVDNWGELESAFQNVNQINDKRTKLKSHNIGANQADYLDIGQPQAQNNPMVAQSQQTEQEFEQASSQKEQLLEKYKPQFKEVIQPLVESGDYKKFFDNAGNFKTGDAIEYADQIVKEKGGGVATRDYFVNLLKQVGEYKRNEPTREKIKEKYKKSGQVATEADIEKEVQAGEDIANKAVDESLSKILPLGLFNRSVVSGWYRGLANIGDYLSMNEVDNSVSRYLQSKSYEADVTQPANYEYNKDEWFKRLQTSVGSSLGASAPIAIPALGATVATGGIGGAAIGGAIGFIGEKAQNTGEIYKSILEKTGDPSKAFETAREFEKKQYVTAPLYFLEGLGMQNLFKGSVRKAITGQAQELAQELPTEYYQGYTQEVAQTGEDKGFLNFVKENPELAVDVVAGTVGQGGIMAGAGKIFNSINSKIPNAQQQYIADMIDKQGAQFAYDNIQKQYEAGAIDGQQASDMVAQAEKITSELTDLKQLGLQGDDAKAFQTVNESYNQIQERINSEQNEGLKIALEAKANALKAEMQNIVQGKGNYAVVIMPGGADATRIIPATEIQNMRKSGSLNELIKEAEKIEVPNDETLNRYFAERKNELGNVEDAPEGFYGGMRVTETKQEEPQQIEGDIATEQINITEDGEGQREKRRQDVLTEPQEAVIEDTEPTAIEQPVSSIEDVASPEVDFIKQKEQEIDIATKPELSLNFITDEKMLNKEVMGKGKNRKGVMVDKKVKYGKAEAPIRAKYEILKSLIDCLDA